MSVVDKGSVLIVGAGASKAFRLPLGTTVIGDLRKQLLHERSFLRLESADPFELGNIYRSIATDLSRFKLAPIYSSIVSPYLERGEFRQDDVPKLNQDLDRIGELFRLLTGQTSESIDDFIVENPALAPMTKLCVSALMFDLLYEIEENQCRRVDVSARTIGGGDERNWVHLLINIIRNGLRSGALSKSRKVAIVTFNYDTIIEAVLEDQFSNSEFHANADWNDHVEVIHVHGKFGALERHVRDPQRTIADWASGIHVVHEDESQIPDWVKDERKRAAEIVSVARKVFVVGFAFAPTNCRLVGLDSVGRRKDDAYRPEITYCNYDGSRGVQLNAEKLKRRNVILVETPGSSDRPISVSDWLRSGHAGDLP